MVQRWKSFITNKFTLRYKKIVEEEFEEEENEDRLMSAKSGASKSSKKSASNIDVPFSDKSNILREKDMNILHNNSYL